MDPEILSQPHRFWQWCVRWVRETGWSRRAVEEEAVSVAFEAAGKAVERGRTVEPLGLRGDQVPAVYVETAMEWRLNNMVQRGKPELDTRPLTDRDHEELSCPDDAFEGAAARDEFEVVERWCGGQGRGGSLLLAALRAEAYEVIAQHLGISVRQLRRRLARITGVATQRFSG